MPRQLFSHRIFVSYSSDDHEVVGAVVELVRLMQGGAFWAPDSIRPGANWHKELQRAIRRARMLLLVWCEHSAASTYVEEEWQYARRKNIPIVPAILDNTPLPDDLREYQRIDIRALSRHISSGTSVRQRSGEYEEAFAGLSSVDRAIHHVSSKQAHDATAQGLFGVALAIVSLVRPLPPPPDKLSEFTDYINAFALAIAIAVALGAAYRVYLERRDESKASVTGSVPDQESAIAQAQRVSNLLVRHSKSA